MSAHTRERWITLPWLVVILLASTVAVFWNQGPDMLSATVAFFENTGASFQVVNASTPLFTIFVPALVSAALVTAVMLLDPGAGRVSRTIVIFVLATLYTGYMVYRLFATFNFSDAAQATFSLILFGAECVAYIKSMSALLQMLWPTNRTPEADVLSRAVVNGTYVPSVDVFIPTYSEPVEILRRTITGCQALRYPRLQIYLLDDQRRPAMRELAAELGCHYRDRPNNDHAKAGNMNAALPSSEGELIVVFDADFVPTQDFVERTAGFFVDPKVALVQTPQNFYSADAVSRNLGLPTIITEEQQIFFRATQPGRDAFGAIICHGTSFVIRRSALMEIGGFPGETLSEDWATSVKLQSAGYRTLYLNELLSAGAAAEFTSEFVTQRLRWARGTLQSFYASTNPLTVPGLTPMQRIIHLCGPLHYLAFLSRFLFLLLPLLYFWFGLVPLVTSLEMLAVFLLPYWLCQSLTLSWITRGHRSAFWSEVYDTMLCIPMAVTIISTLLKPFGKPFKVSAKGQTARRLTFNPVVGYPLLALLILYGVTIWHAWSNAHWLSDPASIVLPMACAVYVVVVVWVSLLASLDVPQEKSAPRFKRSVKGWIHTDECSVQMMAHEISENEVILGSNHPPVEGAALTVSIPGCGLQKLPVQRSRTRTGEVALQWEPLTPDQYARLITYLYCQPGQWNARGVSEAVTFWHFVQAPFRIYGLAEAR